MAVAKWNATEARRRTDVGIAVLPINTIADFGRIHVIRVVAAMLMGEISRGVGTRPPPRDNKGCGRKLFDLLHRLAAGAVAWLLTDGAAIASRAAGTSILGLGGKCLLRPTDRRKELASLDLDHRGLGQGFVADAFAVLARNGLAVAPGTAGANVDSFSRLEYWQYLVSKGRHCECQRERHHEHYQSFY